MMRRLFAGIGILIVVVVAGLLIFAATFNINRYRDTIQSDLETRLGRRVTLGDLHLSVFPLRFRVQSPAIGEDPHFSTETPFIRAQELDVSVQLLPLLHKQVEIDSVDLKRPNLNLVRNTEGVWNFASLGRPQRNAQATPPASTANGKPPVAQKAPTNQPESSGTQQFSLRELTITDGQISITDHKQSNTPSVYDHIDVTLKNLSPNSAFSVDAAVHMASSNSQARLQGQGGPIVDSQPETTPFHGTLSLKQVRAGDVSKFLNAPALNGTDGIVSGETRINSESGKLTAAGQTQIQNGKVHGMELGFPIVAQYDLTDDLATDLLTIRTFDLKLGSTPLEFSGTVDGKSTPAVLNLNLRANHVSIAEAAKLAAASGTALSPGTNATGNVNVNLEARGAANKPAVTGTITGSNVQLSGTDIAQPIQIPSLNLKLTPTQIQSEPFNVNSGGTAINSQFTLQNYLAPSPTMNATVRAPNAQLPAILSIAKAYGVTALDKVSGAGTMNVNLRASGPLKSVSSAEILRALNGTIDINFNNVKYTGANIGRELGTIAGFLNAGAASQSAAGVTNISTMTGNIQVKNGIAETNNLQAKLDIGNVVATGTANLVNQALNLRVTAVLSQSISQKAGGNSVAGFMQTALANSQGELVVPALVTGTLSDPKFAPDVQQITQMKIKGLVPNLENPSSLTGALQNLLGGSRTPSPSSQPQEQPQNPVQQLIGIFGKKKPASPPK
jgi:AsmA protein